MAHYAEIDDDNIVLRVVVINNEVDPTEDDGVAWCHDFFGGGTWLKTSYNANIRKNYAGRGFIYDSVRDAFIPPKQFLSWVLDEETCQWKPPVEKPDDGLFYFWDEESGTWEPA